MTYSAQSSSNGGTNWKPYLIVLVVIIISLAIGIIGYILYKRRKTNTPFIHLEDESNQLELEPNDEEKNQNESQ